ncbi:putative bifunctional diguanylate cyclase/phosphodiesterase, partial [Magnetococcus sp. PR-3]|uniref:putative bifunctional diguanylate cyclase/phosphodiesterase n=1 Tax=Magnetococcus sp. PR-3 TaxID=3120355 RepID=UPI002FCDE6CF
INPAFCAISGYERHEVLGLNPGFSKSDRHDSQFYTQMWEDLKEHGSWSGEIWDRRKNGELYPKRLRINTVTDLQGNPRYYVGIFSDITTAKQAEQRLETLAFQDSLTQLPNRTLFHDRLQQEIRSSRRQRKQFALFFIDLDLFKRVNDTFGHSVGDQLLIAVGQRLTHMVRDNDVVARMGGDEFTIIASDIKHAEAAAQVAQKITQKLSEPVELNGRRLLIGASVGIALYPDDGDNQEDLMRHADAAMYHAKQKRERGFAFFNSEMDAQSQRRMMLESSLEQALQNKQGLILHYQPQIDLPTGALIGVEALVRWQHPTEGLLMPGQFIAIAEESGLIIPMGLQLLEQACAQLRQWRDHGRMPPELRMSVNLSSHQIRGEVLPGQIEALLETYQLEPHWLELEITETVMMENAQQSVPLIKALKDIGVRLAIDDFGTGYSSLSYLSRFDVDVLKIDRSFIQPLGSDDRYALPMVNGIQSLARSLHLEVVAEGVETDYQADVMRQLGCPIGQGYLFSRPADAATIEQEWRC